jgi:hypothetical protein
MYSTPSTSSSTLSFSSSSSSEESYVILEGTGEAPSPPNGHSRKPSKPVKSTVMDEYSATEGFMKLVEEMALSDGVIMTGTKTEDGIELHWEFIGKGGKKDGEKKDGEKGKVMFGMERGG